MKTDAHQHFWKYNPVEYGWIDDRMKVLKRDFFPSDLETELKAIEFDGSVAVQARQTIEETEWLLALAAENDFIKGVVGWVDLCSDDKLAGQLDRFTRFAKLVGVRHVVHDEPDDRFMLRKDFLHGISCLEQYGLTYDLLLFPQHLAVAAQVVKMFPNTWFVLDHISKPLIKDKKMEPWKEDIYRLAENKNVWCKLSGMVTEADWSNWKPEDFYPYLDVIFDAFGADRLMIGSDWPVCRVAGTYTDVMEIVIHYISSMSDATKEKILGGNCRMFYKLNS